MSKPRLGRCRDVLCAVGCMTIQFEEFKASLLADPEAQREYDTLAPEFEALAESLIVKKTQAIKSLNSRCLELQLYLSSQRGRNVHQRVD